MSIRLKAILFGSIVSMILAASIVIAGLKAGITPGVSPLVVLFVWMVLGKYIRSQFKEFLAYAQVTGSGGAAVTAGVIFIAPIIQIVQSELSGGDPTKVEPVNIGMLILASLAGSLLGWGFVGLATQRFLNDPKLPAPEAVACDRLIQTAVNHPDQRPPILVSLIPGILSGFFIGALTEFKYISKKLFAVNIPGPLPFSLPVEASPLYIGIGALLTLPTAILIFAGGLINAITIGYADSIQLPSTTYRWVGGAAMTVAVLYSMVTYFLDGRKHNALAKNNQITNIDKLTEVSDKIKKQLYLAIGAGSLLIFIMMAISGMSISAVILLGIIALVLIYLLSGLGGLLSLQVGSSASPVSGTVFMGMLVLSLSALFIGLEGVNGIIYLVPIVVAACVAICAANDSSQDYKTMQLNGLNVSSAFGGQLVGLIGGAIIVPIVLWLAHESYTLGSPSLPAPQASFFATVLKSLFLDSQIPWGPVIVGAVIGVGAVAIEAFGKRKGYLLSSLALSVGIYLPSVIGTGMLIGALFRFLGTRSVSQSTHTGILNAAGLITGDALFALLLGVYIISGNNLESLESLEPLSFIFTLFAFLIPVGFVYYNYKLDKKS